MVQENQPKPAILTIDKGWNVNELLKNELEYPYCSMIQFQLLQEYKYVDRESLNLRCQKAAVYFPDMLKLNWQLYLNDPIDKMPGHFQMSDNDPRAKNVFVNPLVQNTLAEKSIEEKPAEGAKDEEKENKKLQNSNELTNSLFPGSEIRENPEQQALVRESDIIENNNVEIIPVSMDSQLPDAGTEENINAKSQEIISDEEETRDQSDLLLTVNDPQPEKHEPGAAGGYLSMEVKSDNNHFQPEAPIDIDHEKPENELVFEPLYTKDYFASLGIKLSEEHETNDKLGKQMKSFTQWLKSMKKINVEKLNEPDEIVDKRIQTIAEESNTSVEVVTESMANVLLLQGKHEKAIEMFEKLSLMNPSKSAYFAAIIEVLKKG